MEQKKPFTFYVQNIQTKSFYDEKAQKQRYMIGGYISTGDLDLVNDIATEACRKDLSAQFKGRSIKLDYDHETIRADRMQSEFDSRLNLTKPVLGKAVSEENDGIGNMVWFELNKNWKKFDPQGNVTMDFKSVWEDIENGYYDAFSIAYVPVKTQMQMKNDTQVRLLDKVNLINVALTGNPVNPAAKMMDFSAVMAKSLEYMKEKEDNTMEAELKSRVEELEKQLKEMKSHSQENNGGIMMEKENEAKPEAKAEPQVKPEAKAKAEDYKDEESESEDKEDKKEGKSQEFDAKSFAEMKSTVADLKSKVEELEKANKEIKSVLDEARPAGNGAENEAVKQAKSQDNVQLKGTLDLI